MLKFVFVFHITVQCFVVDLDLAVVLLDGVSRQLVVFSAFVPYYQLVSICTFLLLLHWTGSFPPARRNIYDVHWMASLASLLCDV